MFLIQLGNFSFKILDSKMLRTRKFAGKTSVFLQAYLLRGGGDLAWQHAQLFRQPMDSDEFPFVIEFLFK